MTKGEGKADLTSPLRGEVAVQRRVRGAKSLKLLVAAPLPLIMCLCLPAMSAPTIGKLVAEPFADPEIGASILVGPEDLCTLPDGIQDGVPASKIAFPLDRFSGTKDVEGRLTATAYRTESGVEVVVHARDDIQETRAAVMLLTEFISVQQEPCPNPARAVPTSIGVENLSVVTEDGIAIDFKYNDPKN